MVISYVVNIYFFNLRSYGMPFFIRGCCDNLLMGILEAVQKLQGIHIICIIIEFWIL